MAREIMFRLAEQSGNHPVLFVPGQGGDQVKTSTSRRPNDMTGAQQPS
jgi:hypothetical protein